MSKNHELYPVDCDAGNNPKLLELAFHRQGNAMHSNIVMLPLGSFTPFHTHDTVGNTGLVICSGQRGLRSLSASSYNDILV